MRGTSLGLLAVLVGAGFTAHAAELRTTAASAPSTQPRDVQSIVTDLRATNEQLAALLPALPQIANPDFRAANGPKLNPLLHRVDDLLLELRNSQSDEQTREKADDDRFLYLAMLVALDDKTASDELDHAAQGGTPTAASAGSALALGKWWLNSKNAAAQASVLDGYLPIVKANSSTDCIAATLASMSTLGAASDELSQRALDALRSTATSPLAKDILGQLDAVNAIKSMIGKPLLIKGRDIANGTFSSESMKGKVILVDCWATWCGPCNAEIPRVKEIYAANHPKGLEIVGIDCDDSDDTVSTFTKAHEMPWIQLRELSQTQNPWHPLATQWHVDAIPTMFLIDKKGVLRFIDARDNTDAKIAQLLAEAP